MTLARDVAVKSRDNQSDDIHHKRNVKHCLRRILTDATTAAAVDVNVAQLQQLHH